MTASNIQISRDYENDVLHVLKADVDLKSVTNKIVSENLVVRFVKEKQEIVGFIIDEFSTVCSEWKDQKEYEMMENFDEILDVLNDSCKRKLTAAATESFA